MTSSDDFPGDMHWYPFDDSDADVVFGGSSGSGPVPEELQNIAELVDAARRPGSADELVDENAIVAQLAAVIGNPSAQPDEDTVSLPGDAVGRISVLHKFRTAKLAVATTAMVVMGATAAAAATGSLPSPVQSSVSKGLSGVGISVPAPHNVALAAAHNTPGADARHHQHGMKHKGALGVVASVNGVTDPGTCGTSGGGGSFTLTGHKGTTFIVNVDPTTTFADEGVTDPSFANVCVGVAALAKGTVADTTVNAASVIIAPKVDGPEHHHGHGVFGTVASVNGVTTPGTCGTSGASGSFTLTGWKNTTFTVNVDGTTKFFAPGVTDPSFANICVGAKVGATGDVTDMTVAATMAFVRSGARWRPPQR